MADGRAAFASLLTLTRHLRAESLAMATMPKRSKTLSNAQIAELLAQEAVRVKMPAQKALRRASRRAFFWAEEAAEIYRQGRPLTELTAVGPYISRLIVGWIEKPPEAPETPDLRRGFLTLTEARATIAAQPAWLRNIKGDLQMHSTWSDGEGTIAEMAAAAIERGYEYIAITDHSKGLKIAGGIDEEQLRRQADEIAKLNEEIRDHIETDGSGLTLHPLLSLSSLTSWRLKQGQLTRGSDDWSRAKHRAEPSWVCGSLFYAAVRSQSTSRVHGLRRARQ